MQKNVLPYYRRPIIVLAVLVGTFAVCALGLAAITVLPEIVFPITAQDIEAIESRYQGFCGAFQDGELDEADSFLSDKFKWTHPHDILARIKSKTGYYGTEGLAFELSCANPSTPSGSAIWASMIQWKAKCLLCSDAGYIIKFAKVNGHWFIDEAFFSMD